MSDEVNTPEPFHEPPELTDEVNAPEPLDEPVEPSDEVNELSPYEEGRRAYAEGLDQCENPYKRFCADDDEYDWDRGWEAADREETARKMKEYRRREADATRASLKGTKRVLDIIMQVTE